MGITVKECAVSGDLGSDTVRVAFDTRPPDSLVNRNLAEKLGTPAPLVRPIQVRLTGGQERATADKFVPLNIQLNETLIWHHFYVVDNLAEELIAGADLIRKWKISLDPDTNTVTVDPRAESLVRRTGIMIPIPASGE